MRRLAVLPLALLAFAGCRKSTPPPPAAVPAAHPQAAAIRGVVLERLDVPNYSYLRLKSGDQEVWAAVPTSKVEKGTEVAIQDPMPMKGFESKGLGRSFDVIYFGTLAGDKSAAPAPAPTPAPGAFQHPGGPMTGQADPGDVKVEKAKGPEARTIAELYAQKAALKGKTVLVRGKVVKYNANILGKNWIHLRDGSGSAQGGDHDITVTTPDTSAVGEVITARGTITLEKDLGSGYYYPVLLEDAKLGK